jgi:hypothetical protein
MVNLMEIRSGSLWQSWSPNIGKQICCITLGLVLCKFWSKSPPNVLCQNDWRRCPWYSARKDLQMQCTAPPVNSTLWSSPVSRFVLGSKWITVGGAGKRSGGGWIRSRAGAYQMHLMTVRRGRTADVVGRWWAQLRHAEILYHVVVTMAHLELISLRLSAVERHDGPTSTMSCHSRAPLSS